MDINNIDFSQNLTSFTSHINEYTKSLANNLHFDETKSIPHQIRDQNNQIIETNQQQIELLIEQNLKSNQQIELLQMNNHDNERQIRLLNEQVEQLLQNYNALKDLYNAKDAELKAAEKDAKNSKRFNWISLGVALVSLLVAIGAWVFPR